MTDHVRYQTEESDDYVVVVDAAAMDNPAMRETECTSKQLFQLVYLILGDGVQYKMVPTGHTQEMKDGSQVIMTQSDRQNEYFQRAISPLEQMKQRAKEYDRNMQERDILQAIVHQMTKTLCIVTLESSSLHDKMQQVSNRVQHLVSDLENAHAANSLLRSEYEELKDQHDKIKTENEKIQQSLKYMDACQNHNPETVSDLKTQTILRLEEEKELFKERFELQKYVVESIDTKWKSDLDQLHSKSKRLKEIEGQMDLYRQREANLNAKYAKELLELTQQLVNQRLHISELETKREELLNRLSKLAGDRLTHENTNISDLSDGDRPVKLSEAYSELYDNEWTDAFEELTSCPGFEEKDAIRKLFKILLMSFHTCRQITWQRYHTLKTVASTIDLVHTISSCGRTVHEVKDKEREEKMIGSDPTHLTGTLTIDQETHIKTIWKTTTNDLKNKAVKHLHKVLLSTFDISIENLPNTSKYLASCIELCWKMGVQEKPMHLYPFVDDCEEIFDVQKFRAYTKAGKRVAFVVWPALFLHEGGATLVKGIAQGCQETD